MEAPLQGVWALEPPVADRQQLSVVPELWYLGIFSFSTKRCRPVCRPCRLLLCMPCGGCWPDGNPSRCRALTCACWCLLSFCTAARSGALSVTVLHNSCRGAGVVRQVELAINLFKCPEQEVPRHMHAACCHAALLDRFGVWADLPPTFLPTGGDEI